MPRPSMLPYQHFDVLRALEKSSGWVQAVEKLAKHTIDFMVGTRVNFKIQEVAIRSLEN